MAKIYLLLLTVIALLAYGIYMQSKIEELESVVKVFKTENSNFKKQVAETEDKMNALKGKLTYLDIEARSLQSDIEFIKLNPGVWSIPETEQYLEQLQTGISEARNESE